MENKKKVTIIGAGISGITAGCYLQMNGFETEIFEKNSTSGGLCTSWERGNYTFDGCVHWLLGSNNSSPFFKLWSELLDMKSIQFHHHETRIDIELLNNSDKYNNKIFHLYTNINRLEKYLIDLAPEDMLAIKKLTGMMRQIPQYEIPPIFDDTTFLSVIKNRIKMIQLLPFVFLFLKWKNVTNFSFAKKLTNPFLKEAFKLLFDGEEQNLLIITMPLAYFDRQGAGYPIGGSYCFSKKLEEKYFSLGGKINFNSSIEKIIIDDNKAKGILLKNGEKYFSEITLSCTDWYFTHFKALEGKYINKKILILKDQKNLKVFYSIMLLSLGIKKSFKDYPHLIRFPLEKELISPDGTKYSRVEVHIYNYDPTLAPEGKTVVSVSLNTDNSDFWIDLRKKDKEIYLKNKQLFADEIIDILEKKFFNIKNNIEEIDLATPATYFRYTNNWQGSTQGWMPGKNIVASSPVSPEIKGLQNFFFSSHWSVPGGGLPIAIKNARDTVKLICNRCQKKFSTNKQ